MSVVAVSVKKKNQEIAMYKSKAVVEVRCALFEPHMHDVLMPNDFIHLAEVSRDTIELARFFFFFQAEDGIRDLYVTGVQTCALPISELSCTGRVCAAPGNGGSGSF